MRNVRLMVPDQLHAKMHQLCSLAGVPLAAGYVILAALVMDTTQEKDAVKYLKQYVGYATSDQAPPVVQVPSPVEA